MTTATIDDLDRRIIHALYIDGRIPFRRLADVLDVSEQTVARRYRLLFEAGIVRVVGLLNTQRIGQSDWVVRIRCTPDAASTVAQALARRPDTSWVQLTSGGTEIFSTIRAHDERQRTALLLEQLPSSRRIVSLEAHSVLHLFIDSSASTPSMAAVLTAAEVEQFRPPPPERNGRSDGVLRDEDWELIKILAADGRATYRQLALQTHWHESTVRRRMDELVASGVLYFDMDVSLDVLGVGTRAIMWMAVTPSRLMEVGEALSRHAQVPFAAATTGPTNLVASVACRDDHALFEYLTRDVAALDGITHLETSPIIQSIKQHATVSVAARALGSGGV